MSRSYREFVDSREGFSQGERDYHEDTPQMEEEELGEEWEEYLDTVARWELDDDGWGSELSEMDFLAEEDPDY